ncbi:hypothetical protein D3C80_1190510 [compost metagenome]
MEFPGSGYEPAAALKQRLAVRKLIISAVEQNQVQFMTVLKHDSAQGSDNTLRCLLAEGILHDRLLLGAHIFLPVLDTQQYRQDIMVCSQRNVIQCKLAV